MLAPALAERLTLLLNHVLASEAVATERLLPHRGATLQLTLERWPSLLPPPPVLSWRITPAGLLQWNGFDGLAPAEGTAPRLAVSIDASNPALLVAQALAGEPPAVRIDGDAALAGEPLHGRARELLRAGRGGAGHVQLGAVAGGDQCRLGHGALQPLAQGLQRRGGLLGRKGQPAAKIERGGGVIEPEGDDAHRTIVGAAAQVDYPRVDTLSDNSN